MLIFSDADFDLLDLEVLLLVVKSAFVRQCRGEVEHPDRPHFSDSTGLKPRPADEPLGTDLVMPAYIHGDRHYVTRLVRVQEGNRPRVADYRRSKTGGAGSGTSGPHEIYRL